MTPLECLDNLYPCLKKNNRPPKWIIIAVIAIVLVMGLVMLARAEKVNLSIIAKIESNNNSKAVSPCGAIGTYQIMPCVLQEYNTYNKLHNRLWPLTQLDLFYNNTNYIVANWYMNKRIPEYLSWYGFKDTIDARLACYNAGIGTYVKFMQGKRKLPRETINYIKKYKQLAKGK